MKKTVLNVRFSVLNHQQTAWGQKINARLVGVLDFFIVTGDEQCQSEAQICLFSFLFFCGHMRHSN